MSSTIPIATPQSPPGRRTAFRDAVSPRPRPRYPWRRAQSARQKREGEKPMASFPLVSATGMLGSGYREDSLDKAIELGARMIGCDAGSTDPGPGPLATGTCMFSKAAVKRDTEIMVSRAVAANIPLVIGSAGTSGSDAGLLWMRDIVREIAAERGLHFKLAAISR